ncbi:unnamed protein product [Moneuplotes crassus]|uniref:Uncharacterized protein n=1 Tax=Euplotes crassus TaxID=5936 RepID=A0AAD1X7B7_EUPCR|nr:unnamed protein product [Moneuplotes crassus]
MVSLEDKVHKDIDKSQDLLNETRKAFKELATQWELTGNLYDKTKVLKCEKPGHKYEEKKQIVVVSSSESLGNPSATSAKPDSQNHGPPFMNWLKTLKEQTHSKASNSMKKIKIINENSAKQQLKDFKRSITKNIDFVQRGVDPDNFRLFKNRKYIEIKRE